METQSANTMNMYLQRIQFELQQNTKVMKDIAEALQKLATPGQAKP